MEDKNFGSQSDATINLTHYHINNLQAQVDYKQLNLNKLDQAEKLLDEGKKIIAEETQRNQNLIDHQKNKIVGVESKLIKDLRNLINQQLSEIASTKPNDPKKIEQVKQSIHYQLNEIIIIDSKEIEKLKQCINNQLNEIKHINSNKIKTLKESIGNQLDKIVDADPTLAGFNEPAIVARQLKMHFIVGVQSKIIKNLRNFTNQQLSEIARSKPNHLEQIEKVKQSIHNQLNEMSSIDSQEIEELKQSINNQLNEIINIDANKIETLRHSISNQLDQLVRIDPAQVGFNEPGIVARLLKMHCTVDNKKDIKQDANEIMNESQSFENTLTQLPTLHPIFTDYLETITKINHCFKNMPETDACFINTNNPNPNQNIRDLHQYREKLTSIIDDLETLKDTLYDSSPSFCYVDGMLQANINALTYVDQFFANRKLISDTRIRLANETAENTGLRVRLDETRAILKSQANELKQQIQEQIEQANKDKCYQESNKENEKKKDPALPSSSATSSTTLPLAQLSLNNQKQKSSDDETEDSLKQLTMG